MKKIIKYTQIILAFLILTASCTSNALIGVGTAIDIESPFLTITEPTNLSYLSGSFVIKGTAKDNVLVTSVVIKIESNNKLIKNVDAKISGDNWYALIEGLSDGEYSITVNAYDKAGNSSRHSYKGIAVTIDSTPPEVTITKPVLKSLDDLKTFNPNNFEDIDYYQNKSFVISGKVVEDFRLKTVIVSLKDDVGDVAYTKTINNETNFNEGSVLGSLFNFNITIDSTTEIKGCTDPNKLYYYDVFVTIIDQAGNKIEGSEKYICVYQNGDIPKADFTSLPKTSDDSPFQLRAGASISGNVFDDDAIKSCSYIISLDDTQISEGVVTASGNPRILSWSASAPADPGIYLITLNITDKFGITGTYNRTFEVLDASAPYIQCDELPSYETLVSAEGNFNLSGYSFDNTEVVRTVIAWVPSSESANSIKGVKWPIISENGFVGNIKYWNVSMNAPIATDSNDDYKGFKRRWTASFNVFSDFKDKTTQNEFKDKNMYIYTEDNTGKYFLLQVLVAGDKTKPILNISSPSNEANVRNVVGDRFTISGTTSDYSGIKRLVAINGKDEVEIPVTNGNWSITSDKFVNLSGGNQNFDFISYDKYDNSAQQRLSLSVDNDIAFVTSVTSSLEGNQMISSGTIPIVLKMSKPVNVTGSPKIKLNSGSNVYALYLSLNPEKTEITFQYSLVPGHNAAPLDCFDVDSLELNGGTIKDTSTNFPANLSLPNPGSAASLSAKKLSVDTTLPVIQNITASVADGIYKENDIIDIDLIFSENVSVTGTPLLTLSTGQATYLSGTKTDTLTFSYTVLSNHNDLHLDASSLTGVIKDGAGNLCLNAMLVGDTIGSLKKNKNIIIDTKAPEISSISTVETRTHIKEGDSIDIIAKFDEKVFLISADSLISLNTGGKAKYVSGSGSTDLTYRYSVKSGENSALLAYNIGSLISGTLLDAAGNQLTETLAGTLNKSIVVDTSSPTISSLSNPGAGPFKVDKSITVTGGETNLYYKYSLNNGVNWTNWSALQSGTTYPINTVTPSSSVVDYNIIAMVKDRAGNESSISSSVVFSVDKEDPKILRISSDTPDGTYKPGDTIQVSIELSERVTASGVKITLNNGAVVSINNGSSTTFSGSYTVGTAESEDKLGLKATSLSGTFTDDASNVASTGLPTQNFNGKTINIDTKPPVLSSKEPLEGATNVSPTTTLTLNFNETIKRESGVITLNRKYKSFPAVMTKDEYNFYYTKVVSSADKTTFKNSYELGLQGTVSGATDLTGKYVLKYSVDHQVSSDASSGLLKIFTDIGYNTVLIDIQSSQIVVTDKTALITPFEPLPKGIDWIVDIPAGAFSDAVGNGNSAISWNFTTGGAADPIIRIEKITGDGSTSQPKQVGCKISSETYNSTIKYTLNNSTPTISSSTYNAAITIGTDDLNGETIHIKAYSYRMVSPAISESQIMHEIAYKTGIKALTDYRYIRGSDGDGGPSSSPQFPLSWYDSFTAPKSEGTTFILLTWHINKAFQYKRVNGASGVVGWEGGGNNNGNPGAKNGY